MASIKVRKISNAAVHVNGTALMGTVMEVTIPEIKVTTSDFTSLGQLGKLELPTGFDKMEGSIKMNVIDPDNIEAFGNPFQQMNLMVRSNVEQYSSNSLVNPSAWGLDHGCQVQGHPRRNPEGAGTG